MGQSINGPSCAKTSLARRDSFILFDTDAHQQGQDSISTAPAADTWLGVCFPNRFWETRWARMVKLGVLLALAWTMLAPGCLSLIHIGTTPELSEFGWLWLPCDILYRWPFRFPFTHHANRALSKPQLELTLPQTQDGLTSHQWHLHCGRFGAGLDLGNGMSQNVCFAGCSCLFFTALNRSTFSNRTCVFYRSMVLSCRLLAFCHAMGYGELAYLCLL